MWIYPRSNPSVQLNHRVVVGGFVSSTESRQRYKYKLKQRPVLTVNLLHSGTRMRPILLFSLACAAAARVTEVDCSARFRECLREPGDDAPTRRLTSTTLDDTRWHLFFIGHPAVFASESVSASRRRHAMCRRHALALHTNASQQDSQLIDADVRRRPMACA